MLYLEYKADIDDRTDMPTGRALLIVREGENEVKGVVVCDTNEEVIREVLESLNADFGDVYVENDTSLLDYEYVNLDILCQIQDLTAEEVHGE